MQAIDKEQRGERDEDEKDREEDKAEHTKVKSLRFTEILWRNP